MKKILLYQYAIAFSLLLLGCKKEVQDPHPIVDVIFTTNIDGYSVKFDNTTKGGVSYKWDFGDGATSTEQSPTHTYAAKGKFVPTLYVTTSSGEIVEGSTVLRISKTSPVKLNDNSFADWANVNTVTFTSGNTTNPIRFAKFDYDATSVYFYVESKRTIANNDILDIYIDTDGLPSGYDLSGYFPGAGVDALIEGQLLAGSDSWGDFMYYKGPGWNWDVVSVAGVYTIGTLKEEGGLMKFEGKLDRTKIKGLTGTAMKLGIVFNKNDWSAEVGYLPDVGSPAISIDMSE